MTMWIGTSGWQYADWREAFYPKGLAQKRWLDHYTARFRTVELNNSFYRLPTREGFERWKDATPDDFVFTVKASRYLSHVKRLKDPEQPVKRFTRAAGGLGDKLGPVLVQLPPNFRIDLGRMADAIDEFPRDTRLVVEVRHDSWFVEEFRELLAARNAAFCLADRRSTWLTPRWRTADWGYVRFHWGTSDPEPCYAPQTLAARLEVLSELWSEDEDVFVYFNNDPNCCAVRDAELFARACDRRGLARTRTPAEKDYRVRR